MQASLPNLYRIGRAPEPLAYAPHEFCGKNRFDDPLLAHGEYSSCFRTLYLAEERITCFLEVLQAHRPDLAYLARLAALPDGDDDPDLPGDDDMLNSAFFVASDVLIRKRIQSIAPGATLRWADLRSLSSWEPIRYNFAQELFALDVPDFDLSAATSSNRPLTQMVARGLYDDGNQAIAYISRFGCAYHCVALFEGAAFVSPGEPETIAANDPDLADAVRLFGLTLDPLYKDAVSNRAD